MPDDAPDPLDDLGGLPPDVTDAEAAAIRREVRDRALARRPVAPLTAEELWFQSWYAVVDDEVGGWAIATVDKPTSRIDPMTTRERVLVGFITWGEHAEWLVQLHNRALPGAHVCDYVDADGTTAGACHLTGVHGGRCSECGRTARDCEHQADWELNLLCTQQACRPHS